MKITDSNVHADGAHKMEVGKIAEKMEVWSDAKIAHGSDAYLVDIGEKAYPHKSVKSYSTDSPSTESVEYNNTQVKLKLIESTIFHLTSKTIKLQAPKIRLDSASPVFILYKSTASQEARDEWGLIYEYQETAKDQERLNYCADGSVTTSDGHVLNFKLEFNLSQELNQLSESIGRMSDGQISDGTEFFGPTTDKRLGEWMPYDKGTSGRIDETNNAIQKLVILKSDEAGQRTLVCLDEAVIGAICLKVVATSFSFKDAYGEQGMMRNSLYFKENGKSDTLTLNLAL